MSDLESIEESALEGFFGVSFRESCLDYTALSAWWFPLLFKGYFYRLLVYRGSGEILLFP